MKRINKKINMDHQDEAGNTLVGIDYYEANEEIIIINVNNETLELTQQNIPVLISMLQSIFSGIKLA